MSRVCCVRGEVSERPRTVSAPSQGLCGQGASGDGCPAHHATLRTCERPAGDGGRPVRSPGPAGPTLLGSPSARVVGVRASGPTVTILRVPGSWPCARRCPGRMSGWFSFASCKILSMSPSPVRSRWRRGPRGLRIRRRTRLRTRHRGVRRTRCGRLWWSAPHKRRQARSAARRRRPAAAECRAWGRSCSRMTVRRRVARFESRVG